MLLTLAQMTLTTTLATTALVFVSLFLILCVIVQKPKGGGLAGAFSGGAGAQADSAFGAQASNVAVTLTIGAFVAFLGLAIALSLMLGGAETSALNPAIEPAGIQTTNTRATNVPTTTTDDQADELDDSGFMELPAGSAAPAPQPEATTDTAPVEASDASTTDAAIESGSDAADETPAQPAGDGN